MNQSLYDELVAAVPADEAEDEGLCAGAATPVAASIVWDLVLEQLRTVGCEHKDEIVQTAKQFVADKISRPLVAMACNLAIDFAAKAVCP